MVIIIIIIFFFIILFFYYYYVDDDDGDDDDDVDDDDDHDDDGDVEDDDDDDDDGDGDDEDDHDDDDDYYYFDDDDGDDGDDDDYDDDDEGDNAEDEVEDEKVEDDDVEKEEDDDVEEDDFDPEAGAHTLCNPAQSKRMARFHKSHFMTRCGNLQEKCRAPDWDADTHYVRACAVETHVKISHGNLQKKMPRPRLSPERRHSFCASLRSRNPCPHVTRDIRRATLCRNLQEKCLAPEWAQNVDTHFVRACAVETRSYKILQEPLYTEIYRKNAAAQIEHRPLLLP